MRRLMLLRHVKSDWPDGVEDHERPLAARGRTDGPRIGLYMGHHGLVPDLAIVSTARRARDTWGLVSSGFRAVPPAVTDRRIYEAPVAELSGVIAETPDSVHTLLLVGHNPGLASLADRLVGVGDVAARERLADKYPTGGLAVIDFPVDRWRTLRPGHGRLDRFVTPRMLGEATD